MSTNKKVYTVPVKYIFEGQFFIMAESKRQAKAYVERHCGLVIGGDIHSTLPDEDVDWNFNIHPQKIIKNGR